ARRRDQGSPPFLHKRSRTARPTRSRSARARVVESSAYCRDLRVRRGRVRPRTGAGVGRRPDAGRPPGGGSHSAHRVARPRALDKRTDIWAFGAVLYEMLTGRLAFQGDTISDSIAAILERPPQWDRLPAKTPDSIRRLLQRCLEKDAKRRLHDIADARIEID